MTDCRHHVPGSIHALISFKTEVTYTFINICWAEISRDFEISSKCSVEAIKNTTLSKGFRPMRSDVDLPINSLVLIVFFTHLLFQVLLWSHDLDHLYGRNSQVNVYGCCMHFIYAYMWLSYQPVSLFTGVKDSRKESTMLLSWVTNMVGCLIFQTFIGIIFS